MPAVLCYGATERNGGRDEARRGLEECRRFVESNRRPFIRGVVGLHASFTVSDDSIREAGDLCRALRTVLHVHVAEDRSDVDDAQRRGYVGPLDRLEALGALPRGSILAHGVHFGPREVRHADALGCWIVQNPRSNRNNRVGYPPALAHSGRVALGTDGFVSDMTAETAVLRDEALAHGENRDVASTRLDAGQDLAAELLGRGGLPDTRPDIGEIGKKIDRIRAEAAAAATALWERMAAL